MTTRKKKKVTRLQQRAIKERFCLRCGWRWFPRSLREPIVCPDCKNPRWNIRRADGTVPKPRGRETSRRTTA